MMIRIFVLIMLVAGIGQAQERVEPNLDLSSKKNVEPNLDLSSKKVMESIFEASSKKKVEPSPDLSSKKSSKNFFVFVTLLLPNLEQLMEASSKYGGIVVIRGFYKDSFKETYKLLASVIEKTGGGVIIDPDLFRKYEVEMVPAFVLSCDSCGGKYDIVRGNVSPRFALEEMKKRGDLKEIAAGML